MTTTPPIDKVEDTASGCEAEVEAATLKDQIHLERVYLDQAHELVQKYYATLKSNFIGIDPRPDELVGLLTFPNSGTSWFLHFSRHATGIHSHTVYEKEAQRSNGLPNRDAFMLRPNIQSNERPPNHDEPALVKSHVSAYDEYWIDSLDFNRFDSLAQRWMQHLPLNVNRYIRLVRNPFDNLRARYHLYLHSHKHILAESRQSFRQWFKQDMFRYLVWHACCNKLAETRPLMTVHYSDLSDNTRFEFFRALQFAHFNLNSIDIERAFKIHPPKYKEIGQIPTHLHYYNEDDIHWVSGELRTWLEMNANI